MTRKKTAFWREGRIKLEKADATEYLDVFFLKTDTPNVTNFKKWTKWLSSVAFMTESRVCKITLTLKLVRREKEILSKAANYVLREDNRLMIWIWWWKNAVNDSYGRIILNSFIYVIFQEQGIPNSICLSRLVLTSTTCINS